MVEQEDGEELLVPAQEDFIVEINQEKKLITVELPEGLLNLEDLEMCIRDSSNILPNLWMQEVSYIFLLIKCLTDKRRTYFKGRAVVISFFRWE